MVAVEVRDDHGVDRARLDPGGRRLFINWPVAPCCEKAASLVPVSISASLPPVLTTIGLYGPMNKPAP